MMESTAEKARAVYTKLAERCGEPVWKAGDDPVEALIWTILSANTNDVNSGRAFQQLMDMFHHDWESIRCAPLDAIKAAIRPAGMYNQKAPHLVGALEKLKADRAAYTLDFLADMPMEQALTYLMGFPGVGHKTASIVLLFCFNRGAFPVDTHIQRISQRLGLSDRKASPEKIKHLWEQLLPPTTFYPLHLNLIQHGREICQARAPRCELCPLQDLCDYYQRVAQWSAVG